ncbi:MAG: hypothetical protein H8E76_02275 [Helicobacteraceae bacterium]|nr:hypothetical protein [Candidatus Sulfurimonas ponti]MBL6973147.1 hypothetical protein [Sulfurimonas sp.]
MKYIYVTFFVSVFAMANEITRMESIVEDIEKLRSAHIECMKEREAVNMNGSLLKRNLENTLKIELQKTEQLMQEYKTLLEKEKLKNTLLVSQIDDLRKLNDAKSVKFIKNEKSKKVNEDILENKLNNEKSKNKSLSDDLKIKYEKIIKNKDNLIISLKNQINNNKKSEIVKKEICEDDNPFPSLMMKENKKKQKPAYTLEFKAGTYRLNKESEIYDDMDGNILFIWEDKSSFTARKVTQDWIKISGYFIDRKWKKAEKSLWVKKVNAVAR